ncbi:MAG: hypothetical protein IKW01_02620 [Firmicutes bacterium]|nr:hypothetical protein [Bacillota bacterium]
MRIRNNVPGMGVLRNKEKLNSKMNKTLEKLASGYCINRAGDDASGLSVSEKMRMNITLYGRCEDNVREGINLAEVAEAALQEVSDMMRRSEQLCDMAANGTYTQFERDQMMKELEDLYSEMDRIFQGSKFNEVQLFRHEDEDYSNGEFEYLEEVIETPDELHMWGEMNGVDKKFGTAAPAKGASVTLTMDANVQTAADLDGKSFTITLTNGSRYNFRFSTSYSNSGFTSDNVSGESYYRIGIKDCATVQEAFDRLCENSNTNEYPWSSYSYLAMDKENTKVNGNTVTITFKKFNLQETISADGKNNVYETPEGDGTKANNVIISSTQEMSLLPVDSGDNSFEATGTFQLLPGLSKNDILTDDMKATLLIDRLAVSTSDAHVTIYFTDGTGSNTKISLNDINTVGDLREAIAKIIDNIDGFTASTPDEQGNIIIKGDHTNGSSYLYEYTNATSQTIATKALYGVSSVTIQEAASEWPQITTITLPDSISADDIPFSLKINNQIYNFYDTSSIPPGNVASNSYDYIDITGKTTDEIHKMIYDRVVSQYSSDATITRAGNTITLTAKVTNKPLTVTAAGTAGSLSYSPITKTILLADDTTPSIMKYFQGYSLELDLSDAVNSGLPLSEALEGHGFKLNGNYYQFGTTSTLNNVTLVDISSCNTIEQVGNVLKDIIKLKESNISSIVDINVPSGSDKLIISATAKNTYSNLNFNDGLNGKDGLFGDVVGQTTTATASGGTKIGNPSASISFSGYNKDNFHELYGKGFRVTCATCPGEYINVIFCYDKDQCSFPESFNITIEENGRQVERTIHNMVVELKGMDDGSDIVNSIVTQLSPELDHYTEVAIGTPSSVLEVFDIRSGDRYLGDPANGELQQAEILSGVYTNCIYTVTPNFLPAPDAVVGDIEIDFRNVEIFADANNDDGYIKIHLPYLTLENLKLDPPKPDFSTPEKALETLDRVLNAHNAVSYIRGTIGADYNRLEHAFASLTQATIQTTDAFSRIRDTDMAKAMMEQVKNSVLQNAQQSMQVHAQNMPQSVLQLLKG